MRKHESWTISALVRRVGELMTGDEWNQKITAEILEIEEEIKRRGGDENT